MDPGEGRSRRAAADTSHYSWTCPICSYSRASFARDDQDGATARARAVAALQAHVVSTDGDGHGPAETFPARLEPADLLDHVTIEGRNG